MRSPRLRLPAALAAALLALVARQGLAYSTEEPEPAPRLEVVGFNGQIQVKAPVPNKALTQPSQTPPIMPGSEVTVLNGRAILQAGDVIVRARAGDSFLYHVPLPTGGHARPILLIGLGQDTAIDVDVGDTHAILRSGAALSVRPDGPGRAHIEVHMGRVMLSTPERIVTLSAGMSLVGRVSTTLSEEAQAEALTLPPSEREELRSAPGPLPAPAPQFSSAPARGESRGEPEPKR